MAEMLWKADIAFRNFHDRLRYDPVGGLLMVRRVLLLLWTTIILSGCSYGYDVVAALENGQITFRIDPRSNSKPSCVRRIEVTAEDEKESAWLASVSYDDDCANKFPIKYGSSFVGHPQPEWPTIRAKPLRPGIIYEITTTTGATGYGWGRFTIKTDGQVVNLKQ
jgi:hypothetical protein